MVETFTLHELAQAPDPRVRHDYTHMVWNVLASDGRIMQRIPMELGRKHARRILRCLKPHMRAVA